MSYVRRGKELTRRVLILQGPRVLPEQPVGPQRPRELPLDVHSIQRPRVLLAQSHGTNIPRILPE